MEHTQHRNFDYLKTEVQCMWPSIIEIVVGAVVKVIYFNISKF